jgi:glycosyltransferase involved in cell wall biosynthesis
MKILFVGNAQSIHLKRWSEYFLKKGKKVKILSSVEEKDSKAEIITWLELLKNNYFLYVFSRIPFLGFWFRVKISKEFLKKEKPDILHIHNIGGTYFSKDVALAGFRPLIISVWGSDITKISKDWSLRRLKTVWALKKASVITATSKFLAKETQKLLKTKKEIKTIPFGVDLNRFDSANYENSKDEGKVVIGFIKHLEKIYGVEYLLKAYALVCKQFDNAELLLIGQGSQRENLINLSKELGIFRRVKFIGAVPYDKIPEYLSKIDIFVMPSVVQESFGVAALEAEAMGVSVVATNVGGVPEVVEDKVSGLLVRKENSVELSGAILKLLKDEALRKRMGKKGRDLVEKKYSWNQSAEKMEKLYKSVLVSG